jgi:hypothetical protein
VRRFAPGLLVALVACLAGCGEAPGGATSPVRAPWLDGFAAREKAVDAISIIAPGERVVVRLHRDGTLWRVRERDGWPAAIAPVDTLLGDLARARRVEPKTTRPENYPRLSVQPIADTGRAGVRVDVAGGGEPLRLLLGKAKGDTQRFARVEGEAQAWLVDRPLVIAVDPVAWLDTRLVDVPLARVARVEVTLDSGDAFALAHRDDRFRIEGVPAAAMGDSHAGDALAGALDQLAFDDVARDDGKATPERTVRFIGHDGSWVQLAAWRVEGHVWVRADSGGEGALASAFAHAQATDGWRFRLPPFQAAALMAARSQILGSAP